MNELLSTIEAVCRAMRAAGTEALLIGGFAVNHYGYTRNTLDIDFMMPIDRRDAVCRAMQDAGFTNVDSRDNVVFFNKPGHLVRVDILQVDSETMRKLLHHSVEISRWGQVVKLPALQDLLAMKLFALKQSWDRRVHKDLPDVANLVLVNEVDIEKILRPLCLQFADNAIYEKILHEIELLSKQ